LKSFLNELQAKIGIDLQYKHNFIIKTSRQHYALVRNALAMQCRKDGTKINVYNERGLWFTIDNSFNLEEAETVHPNTALIDNLGVQKFFNEHKETGWGVGPKFTIEAIDKLTAALAENNNQLLIYKEQNEEHLKLIKEYREESRENRKLIKELIESIQRK
jgi:hypothetical protein